MPRLLIRRYRLPLRTALRTARGLMVEREGVLVRLEAGRGQVGYGEAAPLELFGGPDVREVEAKLRALGRRPDEATLDAAITEGGCVGFALASARAALAATEDGGRRAGDRGQVAGDGGQKTEDRIQGTGYRGQDTGDGGQETGGALDYWPVAALLPAGREVLRVVEDRVELGFRTFKWKVGVGSVRDELGLLADLSARLPEGARLRFDANGAWDRRQAETWLAAVAENPFVEFVEQPIAAEARGAEDLLRGLAADYPVTLALDESLASPDDLDRWLAAGWPGVWVLKLALMGDPAAVVQRLAAAKADVVFSSALETAIGARAMLAAAFRWSGPRRALGVGVWPLFVARWADGPTAMPFVRWSDVEALQEEAVWNGAL